MIVVYSAAPLAVLLLVFGFLALLGLTLAVGGTGYQAQHARPKHPPSRHRAVDPGGEVGPGRHVGEPG